MTWILFYSHFIMILLRLILLYIISVRYPFCVQYPALDLFFGSIRVVRAMESVQARNSKTSSAKELINF